MDSFVIRDRALDRSNRKVSRSQALIQRNSAQGMLFQFAEDGRPINIEMLGQGRDRATGGEALAEELAFHIGQDRMQ